MTDQQEPDGFDLDAELSRADDAGLGGIVARDDVPENDAESPANGVDGSAFGDDDDAIEDGDREPVPGDL